MAGKIIKEAWIIFVILGLSGAVFFFPMKLDEGKTCLAQHYISVEASRMDHIMSDHGHQLAQKYIIPYGLIWWSSLAMFAFGLYLTRKKGVKENPDTTTMNSESHRFLSV